MNRSCSRLDAELQEMPVAGRERERNRLIIPKYIASAPPRRLMWRRCARNPPSSWSTPRNPVIIAEPALARTPEGR